MINSARPGDAAGGKNPFQPYAGRSSIYAPPGMLSQGWSTVDYSGMVGLPRPLETFTSGDFSPLAPILPVPIDIPEGPNGRPRPRRWQVPVGFNLPVGQPGTEGIKLACYSDDTEILTRRGWKLFADLTSDDDVATRSEDGQFEWQRPLEYFDRQYDGPLVHFTSRGIDLLVTPNHRVLYKNHPGEKNELIRSASYLLGRRKPGAMVGTSRWEASDVESVSLTARSSQPITDIDGSVIARARAAYGWSVEELAEKLAVRALVIRRLERRRPGDMSRSSKASYLELIEQACEVLGAVASDVVRTRLVERDNPTFTCSGDDFAAFMGAFLSEGCASGRTVHISQAPASKGFGEFRAMLTRVFGQEPSYSGISWRVSGHRGLRAYLEQCGHGARNKRIPQEVLDLSARQLRIFWHFYLLGDGWEQRGNETLATASPVMAGQLQEIAQKMGYSASVKQRAALTGKSFIRGREIFPGEPVFDVFRRRTRDPLWTRAEQVEYSGHVYCVRVPNGILYVRRNGKAIWSGNTFQQLRDMAEIPSIARVCIEIRKADLIVSGAANDDQGWDIVPTTQAAAAMQGNPKKRADFEKRKEELVQFFRKPDPDHYASSELWLNAVLEDVLVLDALGLYVQPCGGKGNGPLGTDIGALALIDGSSIKPLVDEWGGTPRQPAVAYQQYMWSVPRVDLMDIINLGPDATIEDYKALNPAMDDIMEQTDEWVGSEMIYFRQNPRSWTPYGFGPLEQAILPVSLLQARQMWQWEFFRSGSLPSVFMDPGESIATPEEARILMQAINQLGGDLANMHQVIITPPGAKVTEQKPVDLTSDTDTWFTGLITMPFGLTISDLGIVPKIASMMSPAESKMAASQASDKTTRRSALPLARKLAGALFTSIINGKFGQQDMRWSWGIMDQGEGRSDRINDAVNLLKSSVTSIDETRIALDLDPLGELWSQVPLQFLPTGVIPMGQTPPQPAMPGAAPSPDIEGAVDAIARPAKPKLPPAAKPKPKPTDAPEPDATVATQAAAAVPESSTDPHTSATSKEKSAEIRALRRYLQRGRPLERFAPKALRPAALRAAIGEKDAGRAALKVARSQYHLDRRESTLDSVRRSAGTGMAQLVSSLLAGTMDASEFQAQAKKHLSTHYQSAYLAGQDHGTAEWGAEARPMPGDLVKDNSDARADNVSPFVKDLALDALGLGTLGATATFAQIISRAIGYGNGVTAPYEEGYVTSSPLPADGVNAVIRWNMDGGDVCENCQDLDGQTFSEQTLPGFPGDGGFGQAPLCSGGPMCKCSLTFESGPEVLAETLAPSIARQSAQGIDPTWATGADPELEEADDDEAAPKGRTRARARGKDISLASPLASGMVPYDLSGPSGRRAPNNVEERDKQWGEQRDALGAPAPDEAFGLVAGAGHMIPLGEAEKDNASKSATGNVVAAGLLARARDTGRVLLLQRALTDNDESPDPAGGKLEPPGGHVEENEDPYDGAVREWEEEVGHKLPEGAEPVSSWQSGIYRGHVVDVPSEDSVPLGEPRSVANPDGDYFEAALWVDPDDMPGMPLRSELASSMSQVRHALAAPKTARARASDDEETIEDLIARRAMPERVAPKKNGRPDATQHVYDYLAKNYERDDLDWVDGCDWQLKMAVPLAEIEWAHRPGGRDPEHVEEKVKKIEGGEQPKPVVLVDGGGKKLVIADGYYRTEALDKAGHTTTAAWVGTPKPSDTDWPQKVRQMQFRTENHSVPREDARETK